MKNLVKKTLELTRLNSPNTILSIEDINFTEKINDTLYAQKLMFQTKHITVENKIQEPIIVQSDVLSFEELFKNLLTNAVKYTPEGGSITLDAKPAEESVTVSMQNTGIGLTQEQTAHVFDEFYKVDQSRHDFDSSSFGLPIWKRIVEKHGGRI
jgi:two-component system phosphate regulon sensor histidine kinase PhoR